MCGIAGIVDLRGRRTAPTEVLRAMAQALVHRGPDEEGYFRQDGVALASRRLSILGLADGQQPLCNEDASIWVAYNGELFDYPETKAQLEARGHRFRTHCDTELLPHLWEEYGEAWWPHLRGQYAFALYDGRQRRVLLARDRFGICPLYWSVQGEWLVFASEIKALLASGLVPARPDPRGLNQVFTFFALPGAVTCFEGIYYLLPGHYLDVSLEEARTGRGPGAVQQRVYWEMDFPGRGEEEDGPAARLVSGLEEVLLAAVARRLRAEVPVVSYLSGGVDSSTVVALAGKVRGQPIPTFTIKIEDPDLDETPEASRVADHLGCRPTVRRFGVREVLATYPRLIAAAEGPVIDTSCAALLLLAEEVHAQGYKVALTGEGADEWLAGYPWYKVHKLLSWLDVVPGLHLSLAARRAYLWLNGAPRLPADMVRRAQQAVGGHMGWLDLYGLMSLSKLRFFGPALQHVLHTHDPYEDLDLNRSRLLRWHPLNRALYVGARIHLAGLLLHAKGDRVAMHSSVETRYPFLDEEVFAYLARLHPRWKLRGLRDKYLLRLVAQRWLPRTIAWRRKAMFRAPFDSFHISNPPAFVEQLFSTESLRKTGYFDPQAVQHWRSAFRQLRRNSPQRLTLEMGLAGVLSTQLWHHLFIDPSLADLPGISLPRPQLLPEETDWKVL